MGGSGKRGEIKAVSDDLAAALDAALAMSLAAVVGDGGEAAEQGDLLGRGGAEFGQAGDQSGGDDRGDGGDREQDAVASGEGGIGGDAPCDLGLEAGDVGLDAGDAAGELVAQQRRDQVARRHDLRLPGLGRRARRHPPTRGRPLAGPFRRGATDPDRPQHPKGRPLWPWPAGQGQSDKASTGQSLSGIYLIAQTQQG